MVDFERSDYLLNLELTLKLKCLCIKKTQLILNLLRTNNSGILNMAEPITVKGSQEELYAYFHLNILFKGFTLQRISQAQRI